MVEFFRVQSRDQVLSHLEAFQAVGEETAALDEAVDRVLCQSLLCPEDLPPFPRATMDGYAVRARDTFGATESLPALLQLVGEVRMGELPSLRLEPGRAVRISTGGMIPEGADGVVMVEYTETLDAKTIEVYRSIAPGQHVVARGEDVKQGEEILAKGWPLRPQDVGLLAALGMKYVPVYRKPVVAILSTGDEIVDVGDIPGPGQVRDVNGSALAALVHREGGMPLRLGIVPDQRRLLEARCREGIERADCLLLSGGSSVGVRDYALVVLEALEGAEILAHGVAVKPGMPTLIARVGDKPLFCLPGNPVSVLVIFHILAKPMLQRLCGRRHPRRSRPIRSRLTRNLASAQGREDYVRVILQEEDGELWARPVLGASGLIGTMVRAEGLIRIDHNVEGLSRGEWVEVELLP